MKKKTWKIGFERTGKRPNGCPMKTEKIKKTVARGNYDCESYKKFEYI